MVWLENPPLLRRSASGFEVRKRRCLEIRRNY